MAQITGNSSVIHWVNTLQLHLADSGYVRTGPEWGQEEGSAPFSRVYYAHKGCGWVEQGGKRLPLREEHVYLIPAGYRCACGCEERFDHLFFHVNVLSAGQKDMMGQLDRVIELPMKRADIQRMVTLYHSPDARDALTVAQRLYRDVVALIRKANLSDHPGAAHSQMVQDAIDLIHKRASAKLTADQLSHALSVPVSTLTKRFRRELGMPLGAYMDSLLCQKARRMLLLTDLSISEVADLLEFCDPFYFSRYFKRHHGETPSRYRRRMTGKGEA